MVPKLKFDVYVWQCRVQCTYISLIKTHQTYTWALTGSSWLPSQAGKRSPSQPMDVLPSLWMFMPPSQREGSASWGQCHCEAQIDTGLWEHEAWRAWGGRSFQDSCLHLLHQPVEVSQAVSRPLTTFHLPLTFPEMRSPLTELFADCTHIKGFTFSKCFLIFNELILFSLGWVVSWLVLLGKKLKPKCHGVTCSRSPQDCGHITNCPGLAITLITAFVVRLL